MKTPSNLPESRMGKGFVVTHSEIHFVPPGYAGAGGHFAASLHPLFAPIGSAIGLARVRKSARKLPRHHPASLMKYPG